MLRISKIYFLISIGLSLCFLGCSTATTQPRLKVLFVGNSYTYYENLPQLISIISDSSHTKIITQKSVAGGSSLRDHWLGKEGLDSQEKIANGGYDIVVLQPHSLAAIRQPDSLRKYVQLFGDLIAESGAKTYLYQTWARKESPQQQQLISKTFTTVAETVNATVIPVGDVWRQMQQQHPSLELYDPDGSHPSRLGTFLTACVFAKCFLGKLPKNMTDEYVIDDAFGEAIRLLYIPPAQLKLCKNLVESESFIYL